MQDLNLLEKTKRDCRNLLLTAPEGMTLKDLESSFEEVLCQKIDYKALGFTSTVSFLKSIPDEIQVLEVNGDITLKSVGNAKTAHIAAFVKNQKQSRSKGGFKAKVIGSPKKQTTSFKEKAVKHNQNKQVAATIWTDLNYIDVEISECLSQFDCCDNNRYKGQHPQERQKAEMWLSSIRAKLDILYKEKNALVSQLQDPRVKYIHHSLRQRCHGYGFLMQCCKERKNTILMMIQDLKHYFDGRLQGTRVYQNEQKEYLHEFAAEIKKTSSAQRIYELSNGIRVANDTLQYLVMEEMEIQKNYYQQTDRIKRLFSLFKCFETISGWFDEHVWENEKM